MGGPRIFFKRDDLTGFPLAGNKTRMLEFSLAKALEEKVEIILMSASIQSNYTRQLAFACNKLGLETFLFLFNPKGEKDYSIQGNLFLDLLSGAHVKIIKSDLLHITKCCEKLKEELSIKTGKKIHIMRSTEEDLALEAIGYTNCGLELYKQLNELQIPADYLYVSSADTTQAGLVVANKYIDAGWKIVGVNATGTIIDAKSNITKISNNIFKILGLKTNIRVEEIVNFSEYAGEGYGLMSPEGKKAIEIVAKTESIILDPVYSGKAMACLIDHINKGKFSKKENVVFIHTGGFSAIYAFSDEFDYSNNLIIDDKKDFFPY